MNKISFKLFQGVLLLIVVMVSSACGSKEKKPGQTLARVNGEEITILQLNDELQRSNAQPDQEEEVRNQLLESLIERQLIIEEAKRIKIDRTPDVVKAMERAKLQIISQAYLNRITANVSKPSKIEIEDYFRKHPEYFAKRKQFDMTNLQVPTKSFNKEFKSALASANSLSDVVAWMDANNVQYVRSKFARTSMDMSREMIERLQTLPKGRLLIIEEGSQTMIITIESIRDLAITLKDASRQIEQYLIESKSSELKNREVAHLKSLAKIEYTNISAIDKVMALPETKSAELEDKGQ